MLKFWVVLLILQVSLYNVSCEEVSPTDDLKKVCWWSSLAQVCKRRLLASLEKMPHLERGPEERAYTINDLKELYRDVTPGDILKFPQPGYFHFGVYVGEYKNIPYCVVHFSAPEDKFPSYIPRSLRHTTTTQLPPGVTTTTRPELEESLRGITEITPLKDFFGVYSHIIIEKNSYGMTALPQSDIVKKAIYYFETDYGKYDRYHLLWNNCEHFAYWMRYGVNKSHQAETFIELFNHRPFGGVVL